MIKTKNDLKEYMEADRLALGCKRKKPRPFTDESLRFEIALRKYEYALNQKDSLFIKLLRAYRLFVFHRLSVKLGVSVPPNVCGKGLAAVHYTGIVINRKAKIGENLRIQSGCVVGAKGGREEAPVLGSNVYLGSGCKVLGDIYIADGVKIGANAVVLKSIEEPGSVWAGVPAKKIK
ncbi:MAG: serine acetyltransferase [Clostridiales bacterium]|nr:serine acetyltransferase [Clostridiales bacterium]